MFKCDRCGKQSEAGEKTNQVNIVREKEYEQYRLIFDSKTRRRKKEYYTTTGYETHKVLCYCNDCYEKTNQGEFVNGNENGFREEDQGAERRNSAVKRRSKVNNSRSQRIAQ